MDENITSPLTMKPTIRLPQDPSTVDYESEDEKENSDLQLLWSRVMDEGKYKFPSTYTKVEVLLLCWEQSCTDVATKDEVDDLKAVFENRFNYHAEIKYLDTTIEQRLQIRVNTIVANFVNEHDGPNTLLIVYYAGHGRPGGKYGNLELFGQTSPNDKKKCIDRLVWNKTEKLLIPAEADVLEIFDCCYAGQLGLGTKGQRSFEYLAATEEMGSTKVPGDDSFTRALIYALEALVKERADGRFTTLELLNKIKDAPHFPKDQNPMFFNREKKHSAGRIMLHPLKGNGSDVELSRREAAELDPLKGHALTLHFDFSEKPSSTYLETLGRELNDFFERNVGINQVRWGGMRQPMAVRWAKVFQAGVRKRRESMRLQQATPSDTMNEKAIRNDDQLSVQSSSQPSIFSTPYDASSGSQSSTDQLLSAVDQLIDLLADDELLKPLYRAATHSEIIGGDLFEKNFSRLLELCSEELEEEAHDQLQIQVVRLIRTCAAYMSKRLRYMHNDPEYDNIAKERRELDTPKIERWKTEIVEQVKSSTTLPATEPHISISPTSPDFSAQPTSSVSCRACSRVFKGSPQDARANYQRHLRESPRHNRNFGLKCPMPECAKRKSMRTDNLGPHLQKFHSISSKSERQGIIQISQQYSGDRATPWPKYDLQQVAEEPGKDDGVSRDIEQELEPLGDLMDLPDLKNLEEFFLSSNAFKNLQTNFKQFVQRAEISIGFLDIAQQIHSADNNVLPGIYPETGQTASSRIHEALSLRATTMQALHTSIKSRLVQLSSLCWSLGSRMFESYVRRWEPLKDQDKVRIRWRCRCGTMLWDDFRELRPGAAEDLRACLNSYESAMNSQRTNNLALGGNAAGSVARMPVSSHAAASDQLSTVDAAEGGIMTAESPPSNISSLEAKYLLLCFKKPRDTLRLYHLSVENVKNDFQLFQLLRQTYQTYRGLSGRLFSPRHVRSIAFRKLERHPRERVVIRLSPDIIPSRTNPDACHKEHVPKCDTEYDIHPGFPDLDPYVGRNGLEHLLNYPHEAEEQGNNLPIQGVWLKRFPKKERSKLNVCPPYQYGLGWGVEFEETWNVSWILKITLLGCVLPATVFLVCWWSIRGDVQGATGMAALLISYCVLLITLISGFAVA